MSITFPLALPTSIGIGSIDIRAVNAVTTSQSPFTYKQQVVSHTGQRWEASISLPRGRRDILAPWKAFLTSLKGQTGTFLLGDPDYATPQGTALSFKKNLLTYSEQFDQWFQTTFSSVTSNTTIAPDGVTSADTLVKSDGTFVYISKAGATVSSQQYTGSVYLKQGTASESLLRLYKDVISGSPLATLVVDWSNPTANGEAIGNGWYRFSLTATAVDAGINLLIYPAGTTLGEDGTIFAWGAQLEAGSVATEYQPIADAYGPFVNGAGQTGDTLNIKGASPSESSYLKAGDYIQLGSASSATLHQVLSDVSVDESGSATIDIWPDLRSSPTDGSSVVLFNAKGVFRLKENVTAWSIDNTSNYGITFEAVEAIT